jgi:hypothetical protein
MLVIPAKAGIQRLVSPTSKASTPPAEERVTSFFTRVKKEVTKKESTLRSAPGLTVDDRIACANGTYVFVEIAEALLLDTTSSLLVRK